jgi:hypothetical protein
LLVPNSGLGTQDSGLDVVDVGGGTTGGSVVVGATAGGCGATVDGFVTGGRRRVPWLLSPGMGGVDIRPLESVSVPANVPGCCGDAAALVAVIVKSVVVSTPVPVIGAVCAACAGGAVSPGAPMVVETLLADPSWTTSYCCCWRLSGLEWQASSSVANNTIISLVVIQPLPSQNRTFDARDQS